MAERWQEVAASTGPIRHQIAVGLLALSAIAGLAVLLAHLFPMLNTVPLFFAVSAFSALALSAALSLAILAATLSILAGNRMLLLIAGFLALALTTALFATAPRQGPTEHVPAPQRDELRILSWNTNQAGAENELADLVADTQPDIIVLPEYFTQLAATQLDALANKQHMRIYGWESSSATVLVSEQLGEYRLDNSTTPPWAGFYLAAEEPGSPNLLIAHLQRPTLTSMTDWEAHLDWVRERCAEETNVLAVGDFNATLANIGSNRIEQCISAPAALGETPTPGTWPTNLPAWLGASIDQVFAGTDWQPTWFGVLRQPQGAESDHRPIFAVVKHQAVA